MGISIIFDEGDPSGTNDIESLVRLFDPLAPRIEHNTGLVSGA